MSADIKMDELTKAFAAMAPAAESASRAMSALAGLLPPPAHMVLGLASPSMIRIDIRRPARVVYLAYPKRPTA